MKLKTRKAGTSKVSFEGQFGREHASSTEPQMLF